MVFEIAKNYIHSNEGLKLKVYDDATGKELHKGDIILGNPTIAIGRCLNKKGVSKEEAFYLLENDVLEVMVELDKRIKNFINLSSNRQVILIDMAFQLGINGLLNFKKTIDLIEKGEYGLAGIEMLDSTWARQTPNRAKRNSKNFINDNLL